MSSLKEIRTRIASVKSTRKITSAMKMVAAAKLKKAQDSIIQLRPYARKMNEIISTIGNVLKNDEENIWVADKEVTKVLLVIITSNKGLCGAFNTSVIKKTLELIQSKYQTQADKGDLDLFIIGKKAEDIFKRKPYKIIENRSDIFDDLSYENVSDIAHGIMDLFVNGEYNRIDLIYNQFRNAAVQDLMVEQFLPVKIVETELDGIHKTYYDYIFEPSKEYIIKELIPKSLRIQIFKALLDSHASEHGARMTAMHKATDNATELIKDLKLDYNKARQASITNEIIEIVSGASVLEG